METLEKFSGLGYPVWSSYKFRFQRAVDTGVLSDRACQSLLGNGMHAGHLGEFMMFVAASSIVVASKSPGVLKSLPDQDEVAVEDNYD